MAAAVAECEQGRPDTGLLSVPRVTLYFPQEHASYERTTKCSFFFFGPVPVIIFAGSSTTLELRKPVDVSLVMDEGEEKWNNQ